ncbi:hypothetical protein OIU78_012593 [Salix suchowensis]|nr:hypothetical protein OIU78_012593 [Salix suchowensis]
MSPCLNYITGNSSTPSSSCCTQLANVYVKSLIVLPPHSGSGQSLMGVNIVQTRALALPGACTVQTPSIGRCNASSPTDSPSGTPNSPPAGARFNQTFQLCCQISNLRLEFTHNIFLLLVHLRQYHQQIMEHQMQTRQR